MVQMEQKEKTGNVKSDNKQNTGGTVKTSTDGHSG